MNQDKFIKIIKEVVTNSSVSGLIENLIDPPGRKPSESLIRVSKFYNGLEDGNRQIVNDIIKLAVDSGVFGFLCVIDGVRSISESSKDHGDLRLLYVDDSLKNEILLNNPNDDYLHDIYNAE